MITVLLTYFLFSCAYVFARDVLVYAPPFLTVGLRMVFAGAVLMGYSLVRRTRDISSIWRIKKNDWPLFIVVILLNVYVTNVFEMWALQYVYAAQAAFMYTLTPFFGAFIAYWALGQKMSRPKWLGLSVGFAGMIPFLASQCAGEQATAQLGLFSLADFALVFASLATMAGWIAFQELVFKRGYSVVFVNGFTLLVGGAMALLTSLVFQPSAHIPADHVLGVWAYVIGAGIIIHVICYNLYGHLLKRHSIVFMAFANFTSPLFTSVLGWFVLGEAVGWTFWVSLLTVGIGLFLFYREERKRVA